MIARLRIAAAIALGVTAVAIGGAFAQSSTVDEIAKYREALQDGNPAELWEARGEEMWNTPRGPEARVVRDAATWASAPVWSRAPTRSCRAISPMRNRVMDLETRLVWCMVNQQGISEGDATKIKFGDGSARRSDLEALAAYVTSQSRGVKMNVPVNDPHVRDMYRLGEKMFFYRGGTHDFSCATCHGEDGKRIRLQDLPNLTKTEGAQKAYTTWPAYRVSQGELRTFQWRLNDCFRQQRFPDLVFGSEASIALTTYLAGRANGAPYNGPAIKR